MKYVGFDVENYVNARGRQAPRLVCASFHDGVRTELYARELALARFDQLIRDPDVTLVVAYGQHDMGVMMANGADAAAIFQAYSDGRVWDVQTWERMYRIAHGTFKFDPQTRRKPSFSLASLVEHYFREKMAGKSGPDVWRLRYRELDGVPIHLYPEAAAEYARIMRGLAAADREDVAAYPYRKSPFIRATLAKAAAEDQGASR